jgi:hypothetical protein
MKDGITFMYNFKHHQTDALKVKIYPVFGWEVNLSKLNSEHILEIT